MFSSQAMRHVESVFCARVRRCEVPTKVVDLVQSVQPPPASSSVGLRPLPRQRDLTKIGVRDANKPRSFAACEPAQLFSRGRWENSFSQSLKLITQDRSIRCNQGINWRLA